MKTSLLISKLNLPLGVCWAAILFAFSLVLLGPVLPAHAATITVNSTADATANDGACTLREAIINANNNAGTWVDCATGSGADVINITATGTITLLSALPNLTEGLTINGPGAASLTVSGAGAFRVFQVQGIGAFTFLNLTIANGSAMFGGGIYVASANLGVTVNNVIFSNNAETGGAGGAIYNGGMNVTVTNSTFVGNHGYGGAINNDGSGTIAVTNSTFSGNVGDGHPGGTIAQIGIASTTLTNVTISTSAPLSAIYVAFGTLTLRNSIVDNTGPAPSCQIVAPGTVINGGNNIDRGTTCGLDSTNGSMSSTDPSLGSLADNGGSTPTIALLAGSPAIDGVTFNAPNGAPATDQRGIARPQSIRYDIGAYEYQGQQITTVPTMTEWGMIIFIGLAGLGAVYNMRRQRRA